MLITATNRSNCLRPARAQVFRTVLLVPQWVFRLFEPAKAIKRGKGFVFYKDTSVTKVPLYFTRELWPQVSMFTHWVIPFRITTTQQVEYPINNPVPQQTGIHTGIHNQKTHWSQTGWDRQHAGIHKQLQANETVNLTSDNNESTYWLVRLD